VVEALSQHSHHSITAPDRCCPISFLDLRCNQSFPVLMLNVPPVPEVFRIDPRNRLTFIGNPELTTLGI
jgi:hypothetical protein